MSDPTSGAGKGFTVIDKRGREAGAPERPVETGAPEPGLPEADFGTFCLSLATSALYHLGVAAHPETGEKVPERNLPLARETIDTLEMLRKKTRGNLDEREERLLEGLLYELRMRFVEAGKASS
jgi:hypothetical protein